MALSDLKLIIIDVSVVSNTLLLHIHHSVKKYWFFSKNMFFSADYIAL